MPIWIDMMNDFAENVVHHLNLKNTKSRHIQLGPMLKFALIAGQ
jgi:hypothetical protein